MREDGEEARPIVKELDLISEFTNIDSKRIRKEITSDFVKARLSEKQRESIIEMVSSAYFCKRVIESLRDNARWYNWKEKKWEIYSEDGGRKQDYIMMTNRAEYVFNAVMNRPFMTAVLHRNVRDNHLLRLQAKASEEDNSEEMAEEEAKKIGDKLKQLFKFKKEGET